MEQQKEVQDCEHLVEEERYICLEESCHENLPLQNQNLKLDCYTCLQRVHPHEDCLIHIQEILDHGNENKQALLNFIQGQVNFCETIANQLDELKRNMENILSQWISQQFNSQLEQVSKYQKILKEQLQTVSSAELAREKLQTSIEYHLMNIQLYKQQNMIVQHSIELNKSSFKNFFELNFQRMSSHYSCTEISELPKFSQKFLNSQKIIYQECPEESCVRVEKTSFCLANQCLEEGSELECPTCQVNRHSESNIHKEHEQYYVNSKELWEHQNNLIDNVYAQCNQKQQEIQIQSQELQEMITKCQINTEEKLHKFRKLIIEKEKKIVNDLQILKSTYSKEKFKIYKSLLTMTDFSILADIRNKEASFLKIKNDFKTQFEADKAMTQELFEVAWLRGQHTVQNENIFNSNDFPKNPVSQHIQELNDRLQKLVNENQLLKQREAQIPRDDQPQFNELSKTITTNFSQIFNQLETLGEMNKSDKIKIQEEIDNIKEQLIQFNRGLRNNRGGCAAQ